MTQKEPNFTDENGHIVHETWDEDKLVSVEITSPSDFNDHGYYEKTDFDDFGKKSYHIVKTPTPHGYNELEELYENGFLTSQTEYIAGTHPIKKLRCFYSQNEAEGQEILKRETISYGATGKTETKEFSLTGEEIGPQRRRVSLTLKWKSKNR